MVLTRQPWQHRSISCLCLSLWAGADDIEYWHPHDEGYDSRRPLSEPPTSRGSGTPAA